MFWTNVIIGVWIASLAGILLIVASIALSGKDCESDYSHGCTAGDFRLSADER